MSNFDEAVEYAREFALATEKKAAKVVEVSKLKFKLSQINSEIDSAYKKLGNAVYSMSKAEYEDQGLIDSVVHEIDGLMAKRDVLKKEIAKKNNQIECPVCGAKNSADSKFCSKCGEKMN